MATPTLTIQASARGVKRVVVHWDRGDEVSAFELLRQMCPAIKELDLCVLRKGTVPRRAQKARTSKRHVVRAAAPRETRVAEDRAVRRAEQ